MTRADSATVVSMKVFIEQNVILEVIVILHFWISVIDWSMAVFIVGKDRSQTPTDLISRLRDRFLLARSDGAFDLEIVPVIIMELVQLSLIHF